MSNTLDTHLAAYQGNNLYDFDNEILLKWYPKRVLHHAGNASSLLELGLGHGYTTDIFSQTFSRHVVVEGSPDIIQNFHEKHPACSSDIVEGYFESFATDERFDVIVMGFVLEHVDDPLVILRRFREFLVPGGRMFLAVPNAEVLNRRIGHQAGLLDDITTLSANDQLLGHKRYYTVDSLTADIEQAGCRVKRLEGIYLKPFTTRQMVDLGLDHEILDALCEIGVGYPELSCGLFAEIST